MSTKDKTLRHKISFLMLVPISGMLATIEYWCCVGLIGLSLLLPQTIWRCRWIGFMVERYRPFYLPETLTLVGIQQKIFMILTFCMKAKLKTQMNHFDLASVFIWNSIALQTRMPELGHLLRLSARKSFCYQLHHVHFQIVPKAMCVW